MTGSLANRSVSALRRQHGDIAAEASPALNPQGGPTSATQRAGEVVLTKGPQAALLKMRRSEWSKEVLARLAGKDAETSGSDYRVLAQLGLAAHHGSYHTLTTRGRWRADRITMELAREMGLHLLANHFEPRYGGAARVRCICGWSFYRTRAIASYATTLRRDGQQHLEHVGAAK